MQNWSVNQLFAMLEDYQSSDDEKMSFFARRDAEMGPPKNRMSGTNEGDLKSVSDESESEDGEVKDEEVNNPKPKTSTPVDLGKSLENEKLKLRQQARKRLDLSPTKATDKVCTDLNKSDPALAPALVQSALGGEAVGTVTKIVRPRRNCAINSYVRDNYVLGTKIVPKPKVANEQNKSSAAFNERSASQGPLGPRPPSVTPNRRAGTGSESAKNPSILPFLKGSKGRLKEALLQPKVAAAEPCSEAKVLKEVVVSQTHIQDYFSKN